MKPTIIFWQKPFSKRLSLGALLITALFLLAGCGGSSSSAPDSSAVTSSIASDPAASSSDSSSSTSSSAASSTSVSSSSSSNSVAATDPAPDMSPNPSLPLKGTPNYVLASDVSRFLTQATFGPTPKEIVRVMNVSKEAWLEEQFSLPTTRHLPLLDKRFEQLGWVVAPTQDDSDDGWVRDLQRSDIWWEATLWGKDQLRQRVAFSLSQILVISNVSDVLYNDSRGIANYQDILAQHAFGNYRDLLQAVTLNPMMGEYLSMVRNQKADAEKNIRPDENYARELMQLFAIGLVELNIDGSVRLDQQGNPIPTYDQTTVTELARVFTGWNMATINNWWEWTESGASEVLPMKAFPAFHDNGEKVLFGNQIIPAGKTPAQDIDAALDIIFNHPNVAPFISKQLIQRLITSNPSTDYVARVASVFNDNGSGVKGDLKAVIRAILLDTEALVGHQTAPETFGKLREPILQITALWRAFNATGTPTQIDNGPVTPPRVRFRGSDREVGQRPYGSFSVFNFYRPDYQPSGEIQHENFFAPEFQILTESMTIAKTNYISSAVFWRDSPHDWLEPIIDGTWDVFTPRLHLNEERQLSEQPSALLDRLNLLLMGGQMSEAMYSEILSYLNAWPASQNWQREQSTYDAIFLVMASPEFAVQR